MWSPSAALMLAQTAVTNRSFVEISPRRVECGIALLRPLRHLQSSVPVWRYPTLPRRVLRPAQRRNTAGRVLLARGPVGGALGLQAPQPNFLRETGADGACCDKPRPDGLIFETALFLRAQAPLNEAARLLSESAGPQYSRMTSAATITWSFFVPWS